MISFSSHDEQEQKNMKQNVRIAAVIAAASFVTATIGIPTASFARQNVAQKHPTASGVVAGAATHHMLKSSAKRKKASGQKLNFAEKHPTLSAIGVGMGTHHLLKKSAHKKGQ